MPSPRSSTKVASAVLAGLSRHTMQCFLSNYWLPGSRRSVPRRFAITDPYFCCRLARTPKPIRYARTVTLVDQIVPLQVVASSEAHTISADCNSPALWAWSFSLNPRRVRCVYMTGGCLGRRPRAWLVNMVFSKGIYGCVSYALLWLPSCLFICECFFFSSVQRPCYAILSLRFLFLWGQKKYFLTLRGQNLWLRFPPQRNIPVSALLV